jgi:uncharacterized membrane protein HdeD (DUF308 family)
MAQTQVPHIHDTQDWFSDRVKSERRILLWSGIAMMLVGALAIAFPFVSTLSVTFFVATLLIASGVAIALGSFAVTGTGPFFGFLLLGILNIAAGIFIFSNPFVGMVYMTAVAGLIFMLQGAHELSFAFSLRPRNGWGWQLFSGLVSIVAGIILISALMQVSLWFIGFIFGVNFLTTGLASVFVSRELNKAF